MKTINSFISEKLRLNKNSKLTEIEEYFILFPWREDFWDWDILDDNNISNEPVINQKKYDYIQLHHKESSSNVHVFVIQYTYIKEISKKLNNENSKLYEFPANLSLDEFKIEWTYGEIKLKDLVEINKDDL